jgi:hypothetical protein
MATPRRSIYKPPPKPTLTGPLNFATVQTQAAQTQGAFPPPASVLKPSSYGKVKSCLDYNPQDQATGGLERATAKLPKTFLPPGYSTVGPGVFQPTSAAAHKSSSASSQERPLGFGQSSQQSANSSMLGSQNTQSLNAAFASSAASHSQQSFRSSSHLTVDSLNTHASELTKEMSDQAKSFQEEMKEHHKELMKETLAQITTTVKEQVTVHGEQLEAKVAETVHEQVMAQTKELKNKYTWLYTKHAKMLEKKKSEIQNLGSEWVGRLKMVGEDTMKAVTTAKETFKTFVNESKSSMTKAFLSSLEGKAASMLRKLDHCSVVSSSTLPSQVNNASGSKKRSATSQKDLHANDKSKPTKYSKISSRTKTASSPHPNPLHIVETSNRVATSTPSSAAVNSPTGKQIRIRTSPSMSCITPFDNSKSNNDGVSDLDCSQDTSSLLRTTSSKSKPTTKTAGARKGLTHRLAGRRAGQFGKRAMYLSDEDYGFSS